MSHTAQGKIVVTTYSEGGDPSMRESLAYGSPVTAMRDGLHKLQATRGMQVRIVEVIVVTAK